MLTVNSPTCRSVICHHVHNPLPGELRPLGMVLGSCWSLLPRPREHKTKQEHGPGPCHHRSLSSGWNLGVFAQRKTREEASGSLGHVGTRGDRREPERRARLMSAAGSGRFVSRPSTEPWTGRAGGPAFLRTGTWKCDQPRPPVRRLVLASSPPSLCLSCVNRPH